MQYLNVNLIKLGQHNKQFIGPLTFNITLASKLSDADSFPGDDESLQRTLSRDNVLSFPFSVYSGGLFAFTHLYVLYERAFTSKLHIIFKPIDYYLVFRSLGLATNN